MWKEFKLGVDNPLFQFLYDKVRNTTSADTEKEIKILNRKTSKTENYLIKFDWQEGDICGLEFFKKEE